MAPEDISIQNSYLCKLYLTGPSALSLFEGGLILYGRLAALFHTYPFLQWFSFTSPVSSAELDGYLKQYQSHGGIPT